MFSTGAMRFYKKIRVCLQSATMFSLYLFFYVFTIKRYTEKNKINILGYLRLCKNVFGAYILLCQMLQMHLVLLCFLRSKKQRQCKNVFLQSNAYILQSKMFSVHFFGCIIYIYKIKTLTWWLCHNSLTFCWCKNIFLQSKLYHHSVKSTIDF